MLDVAVRPRPSARSPEEPCSDSIILLESCVSLLSAHPSEKCLKALRILDFAGNSITRHHKVSLDVAIPGIPPLTGAPRSGSFLPFTVESRCPLRSCESSGMFRVVRLRPATAWSRCWSPCTCLTQTGRRHPSPSACGCRGAHC